MSVVKIWLWLLFLIVLVGCETPPLIPDDYDGSIARVYDTVDNVETKSAYFFELDKVDGKTIKGSIGSSLEASYGQGAILTVVRHSREVPAGNELKLTLLGMRKYAAPIIEIINGSYKVHGDIVFTPQQDKSYTVNGELSKEYSAIWLEDAEGKIVSNKIERPVK